jgi:F5/8 type C domain
MRPGWAGRVPLCLIGLGAVSVHCSPIDDVVFSAGAGSSGGATSVASGSVSGADTGSISPSAGAAASGSAAGSTTGGPSGDASGAATGSASTGGGPSGSAISAASCPVSCTTAIGCPAQSCYVASANPVPPSGFLGIPDNKLLPQYAIDGKLTTRYSTGKHAVGAEWFRVDLCRTVSVDGISLNDTVDPTNVAASYNVQVSVDGTTWMQVAASATTAPANLTVTFPPVLARFVRVNQTGAIPMNDWWSIDEFSVTCGGPSSGGRDAGGD